MKKAPDHLKTCGRNFWRRILREYDVTEVHHFELLAQASACLDRIEEARQQVEADGSYVRDRYDQLKPHPGIVVERDCRRLFASLCREMALDIEPPKDAPRGKGRY